ncbi:MAG: OmpH family outer membrane protein [Bacteroidaceae bacterium]|nr:OmpH family outer membrane protein [Bacteroidaceae bacterium]MBO4593359.1 OmpH family outer membrane protein [Bacteroidaceae bacterium]MBR4783326.1 OmpH family outer membrane protein [Bacteroidaceae bacterium]
MKKTILFALPLLMGCAVMTTSCSKEDQSPKAAAHAKTTTESKDVKIAYVDIDTLMAKYQYYLDCSEMLEKKRTSISNTLNNKGLALQKEMADFQQKVQNGTITQDQATKTQAALIKKQNQLQSLQDNLAEEFQKEQNKYNEALHDSIDNFLASYNKTAGYTYILSRSNDNILLADPNGNITDEVIEGLNKRYKKGSEKK